MQTKTIFYRHNISYNTGVAVQDNAEQQWWYSTILAANTVSNTGKFSKMVHPDFLVMMVVEVLITLTQKINICRQQTMMKILVIRMANHPLYPTLSPILSTLLLLPQPSATIHRLQKALSTKKVKKESPAGLEHGSQRFKTSDIPICYLTGWC